MDVGVTSDMMNKILVLEEPFQHSCSCSRMDICPDDVPYFLRKRTIPRREFSEEDYAKYYKEVMGSQGFDINFYEGMIYGEFITPLPPNLLGEDSHFIESAQAAVEFHNKGMVDKDDFILGIVGICREKEHQCGPVEFQKLLKVNISGRHLFITLEAKDLLDGKTKTYQTIVETRPGCNEYSQLLILFRLKPGFDEGSKDCN